MGGGATTPEPGRTGLREVNFPGTPVPQIDEDTGEPIIDPDTGEQLVLFEPISLWQDITVDITAGVDNVGDVLSSMVASEYGIMLPAALNFYEELADRVCGFDVMLIPRSYLWNEASFEEVFFYWKEIGVDFDKEPYGLPFRNLRVGFNIDSVTNAATITDPAGGAPATSENTTSRSAVGPRSARIEGLLDAPAQADLADTLTRWFDEIDFVPQSFEITGGMIEAHTNEFNGDQVLQVQHLLLAPYAQQGPLYRWMSLEATGAGGTPLSFGFTSMSATLTLSGDDWRMRLGNGVHENTAFGFILDDTELGVLDENRI
jgi:hypothetical protein